MRISFLLTFVTAIVCAAVPAQSTLLRAEIEHSEHLEAVPAALTPGQEYDSRNLPLMQGTANVNRWYRVPAWLAGTWHKDSQTDFFRYDYRTDKTDTTTRVQEAKSDGIWGTQKDGYDNVWQFDPAPFVTSVDGGEQMVVQLVRVSEPLENSDTAFVRRSIDTQIRVDKATNVIKGVESGEQITTYSLERDGLIKRETSAKVFDREGQPLVLGKSFSYEQRTAPFAPQNYYLGKDMRELFQQFLASSKQPEHP